MYFWNWLPKRVPCSFRLGLRKALDAAPEHIIETRAALSLEADQRGLVRAAAALYTEKPARIERTRAIAPHALSLHVNWRRLGGIHIGAATLEGLPRSGGGVSAPLNIMRCQMVGKALKAGPKHPIKAA